MSEEELKVDKAEFLKLLEEDKEFRYAVAGRIGLGEILARLEEHDKKFVDLLEELRTTREMHDRRFGAIEESLGALVESYLVDKFSEELRSRGLCLDEMRSVVIDGREIDALMRDEEVFVVEVKSTIRKRDVYSLLDKVELVKGRLPGKKVRGVVIGIRVGGDALEVAKRENIETFCLIKRTTVMT